MKGDKKTGWPWLIATCFVLAILLAFQIVWFFGTTTLKDYQSYKKEFLQITDDIARIKAAAQGGGGQGGDSTKALLEPLNKKLDFVGPQLNSTVTGIRAWNRLWAWSCRDCVSTELDGSAEHGEVRMASSIIQILGLYILPLLYGGLGALLSIVQKMQSDDSNAAIRKMRPGPRLVTGMVAGPMIGMFISPEFLNSLAFQATPFLLAFIGGYATDVFFALIDKFLANFRSALTDKKQQAADGGVPANVAAPPQPTPLGANRAPEGA